MSDLTEWLRTANNHDRPNLGTKAADEIERLRALAPQLHQHGGGVEASLAELEKRVSDAEADRADDFAAATETGERVDLWEYEVSLLLVHAKVILSASSALAQQPLSVQEGWRPIAEADNGIAHIIDAAGLHIGNSLPIWARDTDCRIFECLWADDGKRAYWWDIEGESPVDPVEFMPHPLAALKTTGGSPE